MAWFIGLPCGVSIASISYPLVVLLFERGAFTNADSIAVTGAVVAYAFGIPATILTKIFMPPYYANGDTKTPMQIAVFCILINLFVSLFLIYVFGFDHVALAIATTASAWANVGLLILVLHKRGVCKINSEVFKRANIIASCALGMGIFAYFGYFFFAKHLPLFFALTVDVGLAAAGYFIAAHLLGIMDLKQIFRFINKRK